MKWPCTIVVTIGIHQQALVRFPWVKFYKNLISGLRMRQKTKRLIGMWSSCVGGNIGRDLAITLGEGGRPWFLGTLKCGGVKSERKRNNGRAFASLAPPPCNAYGLNALSNDRRASMCLSDVC